MQTPGGLKTEEMKFEERRFDKLGGEVEAFFERDFPFLTSAGGVIDITPIMTSPPLEETVVYPMEKSLVALAVRPEPVRHVTSYDDDKIGKFYPGDLIPKKIVVFFDDALRKRGWQGKIYARWSRLPRASGEMSDIEVLYFYLEVQPLKR